MYIFVFGVIGTIITFSVVAPLTYIANKNNMFYFTFYDKSSFIDEDGQISHHLNLNHTLPVVAGKTDFSNHLMLNSYLTNDKNETLAFAHKNTTLIIENSNQENNNDKNIESLNLKNNTINDKTKSTNDDYYKDSIINFSMKDILLFSAVISATDTVAALTFIKEDKDPKLFAILFGEGVLNDAVCIVLYRIIKEFCDSNEGKNYFYI